MEKQHLKRIGYGFSALVLGLAAVNFFPVVGAYANTDYDLCSEEDVSSCFVDVTAPDSLEYTIGGDALVFSGSFNGNLIVHVDGEPYTDGLTLTDDHHFTLNLELDTAGSHEVKFLVIEQVESAQTFNVTAVADDSAGGSETTTGPIFEFTSKTVNINESFTVKAAKNGTVTAYDVTNSGSYMMALAGDEEQDGPTPATEDQIAITESAPGEYTITPLKAGQYTIGIQGYDSVEGVLTNRFTEVMVLAVGATTEAATTVTDVLNNWAEANNIAEQAWADYRKVADNPNSTEEEIEAAYEAFIKKDEEAFKNAELKEVNAFGDDSEAIREAVYSGKMIATAVSAEELSEADVKEEVKDAFLSKLDVTFASNVKYYNIDLNVYADGEFIGTLKELTGQQVVVLSGYEAAPAGYKRVYKVMGYHTYIDENGEEQVEIVEIDNVEFDEETGAVIFGVDKLSTYLVAYKDELNASVNTGVFTGENGSASASALTSVIVVVVAISLFGAFKFAKSRK